MKQITSPAPVRSGVFRTLLIAAPFALLSAGQAAAEPHPEADARVLATSSAESTLETASQRGRERTARRFDRRSFNQDRRARRGARREGRSGPAALWFGRRAAAALDLTEEQRDQMREAMREIGDNRRTSRRGVADARRSFQRAARDPERSAEEVQALGEALGRAQADHALQRRSERERIAGILTEEQREQLDQMRERRGPRARNLRRRG
ncbi:MAG: hypothetical protein F4023_10920 [Acidobacteria bacterium]|nr:hypothetical protein [Acidobacteriota bacterium]MYK80153.1 hypothetical protein [Acidobacteriota bacterium]